MTNLDKRVTDACHRIEELYYETEGHCCASFSGGKDSTVMLALYDHEPNRYKASMHWLKDVYIAQNVILPFDEAYERERENVVYHIRTDAAGNVAQISSEQQTDTNRDSNEYVSS